MSKAGRNTGSARIELHGTDRAAGRTRAGDKSHLFIDQTRTRLINHFNHYLIKNPSNLTARHSSLRIYTSVFLFPTGERWPRYLSSKLKD
jgi:hypothetical protein